MSSLAPGDRIGPYEVRAALGAGGMGEVYRAHDTTLGREVALKVLHESSAANSARLTRFDREARILASLNHPNIATIHGIVPSDAGPALVLELVEGPTLQDALLRGALPIADTLRYARQVAEALEAAHEQGVIHRDLKPANVKIRPDGTVKVLDFGIAKILDADEPGEAAGLPTLTGTGSGVLIGTTAYMSPEQARGAGVTKRSDVWAFGAMLFEMLTGKRAFTGATTSDVIAAVLQGAPDWSALPASTPPGVVRLVRRCLERDAKARLHDIGDARLDIEEEERALRGDAALQPRRSAGRDVPVRRLLALALAAGVVLAVAAAYLYSARSTDAPRQEVRLQMAPPRGTQFVRAISLDGRTIAFVAATDHGRPGRMWIRPLAAAAPTELPGTDGAIFPFWSSDGRSIAFFADRKLTRVSVSGGNPVVVCDAEAGRGGVWLDDDTIVFAPTTSSPLVRVSASGGTPAAMTTLGVDETSHRFPERLPGKLLAYYVSNRAAAKNGTRFVSIDAPDRAVNFVPGAGVGYLNGFLIFVRTSGAYASVLAQPLKLPDGQLTGEPLELGRTRISEVSGRYVVATSLSGVIAMLGPIEGVGQFTWIRVTAASSTP